MDSGLPALRGCARELATELGLNKNKNKNENKYFLRNLGLAQAGGQEMDLIFNI